MADTEQRLTWFHHVHDYFFPHERNRYRPHFFSVWSLALIAGGVLILQAAYLAETRFVFTRTDFLASVLPAVLVDLTNEDRTERALGPVAYDPGLERAAQLAVNDMAAKGYFAHNSPEGKTPWHWLQQAGYTYAHAGQNLAVNFTDSQEVQDAWLKSPTHRANILKPEFTHIGIAVANGTYKGREATFVVQYFGTPRAAAAPEASSVATPVSTPSAATPGTSADTREVAGVQLIGEPQGSRIAQNATYEPGAAEVRPSAASGTQSQQEAVPVPEIHAGTPSPTFLEHVAASPNRTLIAILTVLMATTIVLLAIAVGTHARHQYLEVIGGGLALLVLIMLVLIGASLRQDVEVPLEGQGSTVETTLPA